MTYTTYDEEKEEAKVTGGRPVKEGKDGRGGNNPVLKALYDDGPSLADVMRQKLDDQKARNDAEFADVDPVTRLKYQGYDFLLVLLMRYDLS